jgi:hypothetical protein
MPEQPELLIARHKSLKAARANFESVWQEIAELVLPRCADFTGKRSPGEKRTEKVYDATAIFANETLAAGLHAMLTNPAVRWFRLRMTDPALNRREEVKAWLETANEAMYADFSSPARGFVAAAHETYLQLGAFGTAPMFIGETRAGAVRFRSYHLASTYLAESEEGRIDTVHLELPMTARQMGQRWPSERLPRPVVKALADNRPDQTFTVIHCTYPRTDRAPGRLDAGNMPFAAVWLEESERQILEVSGFEEFPWLCPRWTRLPGEIYGRSPAWTVLPDVKMLNVMSRTVIRAAQKVADPPMLLPDDGVIMPVRTTPGGINYGGIDARGTVMMRALENNARIDISLEMMEQRRTTIRTAFLNALFQTAETVEKTATQVLKEDAENMLLINPTLGRQQGEYLGPMIIRVFGLKLRAGEIPPPPRTIQGREFDVEYTSPAASAQRAQELLGISRTYQVLAPFAATTPDLLDNFDTDEIGRGVAELNGMSPRFIRAVRQVEAIRAARAKIVEEERERLDQDRGARNGALLAKAAGKAGALNVA